MKTKREVLDALIEYNWCKNIGCDECPYNINEHCNLRNRIEKIGAMAIFRQNRKKEKPLLSKGTKIRFANGRTAIIEVCDFGIKVNTYLRFDDRKEKLDYLIGKTWEVVE